MPATEALTKQGVLLLLRWAALSHDIAKARKCLAANADGRGHFYGH